MQREESGFVASCICGRARIVIPRTPDYVCRCNCKMCTKSGFQGVYFSSDELRIEGRFESYVRADISEPCLTFHRCRNCGSMTHWTPLGDPPHDRMGVNARLLDPSVLQGVEVRHVDGASW